MVMTSVIYDDMLIKGRSLDGKMSFKFTAKNTEYSSITDEKPENIINFVKEKIFEMLEVALQDLTNDEELWAEVREEIMVENNELQRASYQNGLFIDAKNRKVSTEIVFEKVTKNSICQKYSTEFQDFETPYGKYEYDVQVHYHFPTKGQERGKMTYQLELTKNGETTIWK